MQTYSKRLFVIYTFLLFFVSGCIHWPDTFIPTKITQEQRYLQQLTASLKSENWQQTGTLFSQGYHSGFDALKVQIESSWLAQDLVDLKFKITDLSKTDGMILIQTEWQKTFLDKEGKPIKEKGESDILLKPLEKSFRILAIKGNSFL